MEDFKIKFEKYLQSKKDELKRCQSLTSGFSAEEAIYYNAKENILENIIEELEELLGE